MADNTTVEPRTGAERWFAEQMKNPEYAAGYHRARARIDDMDRKARMLHVKFYKDNKDEWRWRASDAGNAKILAVSSEGYHHAQDCINAAIMVMGQGPAIEQAVERLNAEQT